MPSPCDVKRARQRSASGVLDVDGPRVIAGIRDEVGSTTLGCFEVKLDRQGAFTVKWLYGRRNASVEGHASHAQKPGLAVIPLGRAAGRTDNRGGLDGAQAGYVVGRHDHDSLRITKET